MDPLGMGSEHTQHRCLEGFNIMGQTAQFMVEEMDLKF